MGASRLMRKRELREKWAADKQIASDREKALLNAVSHLREAMLVFAKGSNWIAKNRCGFFDKWFFHKDLYALDILWVGPGSPEELAVTTMKAVFGKNALNKSVEQKVAKEE